MIPILQNLGKNKIKFVKNYELTKILQSISFFNSYHGIDINDRCEGCDFVNFLEG